MTGLFVVFEGGEGAGKTTQVDRLAFSLIGAGVRPVVTREPGTTVLGRQLRRLLLDSPDVPIAPKAEALLYAADRADHAHTIIRPALEIGHVVICDRHEDSSIAYQGHGRDLGPGTIGALSRWATDHVRPDLVILLDIDPAIGLARAGRRGPADRIEQETLGFHERVRAGFLQRAAEDPSRYLVIDAAGPADIIADQIISRVVELIADDCFLTRSHGQVLTLPERTTQL